MGINVKAIETGYYKDIVRVPGSEHDHFTVEDPNHLSRGWMAPADDEAAAAFKKRFKNYQDPRRALTNPEDKVESAGVGDDGIGAKLRADDINENKLRNAVLSLDVNDDNHWTKDGLPLMAQIEKAYGSKDVDKKHVDLVMPGWNRDLARVKSGQA